MQQLNTLRHQLLIAMPGLHQDWFAGSVVYLCEHGDDGAMGLVLNRVMPVTFHDICEQLEIERQPGVQPAVLCGGPVSPETGFILHREPGNWTSTLSIGQHCHLTSSKDILRAIADGTGPESFHLALGYAGWDAEQLERELRDNAWLTVEADDELLFRTPTQVLYDRALQRLGISAEFLSQEAGHA
jgi:putative transcriptional regulator